MGERSEYQGVWGGGCVQKGDSIRALVMRVIPIAFFAEAGHGNNDLSAQEAAFLGWRPFAVCLQAIIEESPSSPRKRVKGGSLLACFRSLG